MGIFLKRGRGSITVFVTLILVPTIFFTGFLVDLARIKLYSNQAVMTADNYGNAVLSQYDNLLKELYGLFAVTQSDEGLEALSNFEEYMKSSFDPTVNDMNIEGFMPYRSADISLGYEFIDDADLGNSDIFTTQVADFMKFRAAQVLLGGIEGILSGEENENVIVDSMAEVKGNEDNSEVAAKKVKVDEKVESLIKKMETMYINIVAVKEYRNYFDNKINKAISDAEKTFNDFIGSENYRIYRDYINNEEAIEDARDKEERIEEAEEDGIPTTETLTDEDRKYLKMGDDYDSKEDEIDEGFDELDDAIENIEDAEASYNIDVDYVTKDKTQKLGIQYGKFGGYADDFAEAAEDASGLLEDVEALRAELEETMNSGNVDGDLRDGIEKELEWLDHLKDDKYSGEAFTEAANEISQKKDVVDKYKEQVKGIRTTLKNLKDSCKNAESVSSVSLSKLDMNSWLDFSKDPCKQVWSTLNELFEGGSGKNKEGNKKKDAANEAASNAMKEFKDDEKPKEGQSKPRDIPAQFDFDGTSGGVVSSDFSGAQIFDDVSSGMKTGGIGSAATEIIDNLYLVMYDTGMFSSRVTNVKDSSDSEETLVGVPFSDEANYAYQAELEYMLAGHYDSMKNWTDTRNRIVAFRFTMNFVSTYTILELNNSINGVSGAIPNPIIAFAVNAALRLAVASIESAADWSALKDGEKVVLLKKDTGDLQCINELEALFGGSISGASGTGSGNDKLKLGYNDYVMLMLIFMTDKNTLAQRTANLISLNVSFVKQGSPGELTELSFKPENAHTAVKASCGVQMDFVVMPKGFAKRAADDDTYQEMEEFEDNSYKYTVIRGY